MSNRRTSVDLTVAQVMAHCGGSPAAAVDHLARAISAAPQDPQPYAVLAGLRPELADVLREAGSPGRRPICGSSSCWPRRCRTTRTARCVLIDYACAGPGLPAELVAEARRFQAGA